MAMVYTTIVQGILKIVLNEDFLLCALFYSDHLEQVKVLRLS